MTAQEIKKALSQYQDLAAECRQLRNCIEKKQTKKDDLQRIITNSTVQNTVILKNAQDTMQQMEELMMYYVSTLSVLETIERQILQMIDDIDEPDERRILRLRYIEGYRFEDIPDELHISPRTMWNKYQTAIKKIQKAVSDDEIPQAGAAVGLPNPHSFDAVCRRA